MSSDKVIDGFADNAVKKIIMVSKLVNVVFVGVFIKPQNAETSIKHFVTKSEIIDNNTNLKEWYKEHVNDKMLAKFEEFQEKDSGWALLEILHLKVNINEYNPISVGISTFVDLPPFIRNSKSVINIKNNDPYCFLWSVVCALYPAPKDKNVSRVSSYPHFSKVLKLGNIKFPIALKDIPNFEQLNGLAINVFTVVDKEVAPLLLSKRRDCQDWFANELHQTALELNYILNNPKPMTPLGSDERHSFRSALTCHICEGPFDSESDKVMDHDHDWIILKKAKGIQRSALKEITFDDYYKCLMDRRQVEIQQNFITTSKHNVYTVSQKKVALSPYDDKRMVNYLYTDTEEPHAKKPKRRIVPTPVNTDTPQDPIGIRSTVSKELLGEYIRGTIHCGQCKTFFCFCEESLRRNPTTTKLIPPQELFKSPIDLFCYSSHGEDKVDSSGRQA
nr:unnamed protein product [Callosobruchus analis]